MDSNFKLNNMPTAKEITILPGSVLGHIKASASKSSMQRALAAALVKKGISVIHNPGTSNDDKASLEVIKSLGALVTLQCDNSIIIDSSKALEEKELSINFGESGLGIRMFTPIAALKKSSTRLTGGGSLRQRPMHFFEDTLPQLGVQVSSQQGKLPIEISGGLHPKTIEIDGGLSSQFLTGLLFAYSALNASSVEIKVKDLKSKPYIDLTLKVLQDFGLKVPINKDYRVFSYENGTPPFIDSQISYTVEGDWSGGAFLLVMGAIAGEIHVTGLDIASPQADKKILDALKDSGAIIEVSDNQIRVKKSRLRAFNFDATDCPDLFPPLVALAAFCEGDSHIKGVHRLTHKESNRSLTLQREFAKLGVTIHLQDDLMIITGVAHTKAATVSSCQDHRIAMACALAALNADGEVIIKDADAINKSYPKFYEDLFSLKQSAEKHST